eukprot:2492365-Pyramimonas_sp.AAC.1
MCRIPHAGALTGAGGGDPLDHDPCESVPKWADRLHAGALTSSSAGAPYWARSVRKSVPTWAGRLRAVTLTGI